MEALVETEEDGWLLPRFAPAPWERIAPHLPYITHPRELAELLLEAA